MTKEVYKIRFAGDPVLKKKAQEIENNIDLRDLAAHMTAMMFKYDGIGLAAPQIGISKRLIVINTPSDYLENNLASSPCEMLLLPQMPVVLINPKIISFSSETSTREEGCLSVPGIYAPVTRPEEIVLKAQLLTNETIEAPCGGLLARILQHEIDHLDGILFIDRLSKQNFKEIKKQLERLKMHHLGEH